MLDNTAIAQYSTHTDRFPLCTARHTKSAERRTRFPATLQHSALDTFPHRMMHSAALHCTAQCCAALRCQHNAVQYSFRCTTRRQATTVQHCEYVARMLRQHSTVRTLASNCDGTSCTVLRRPALQCSAELHFNALFVDSNW
jgi:hypothetical protein